MTDKRQLLKMARYCGSPNEAWQNAGELLAIGDREAARAWDDLARHWADLDLPIQDTREMTVVSEPITGGRGAWEQQ